MTRLLALGERPRIVVVDNGSTDGTAELVRDRHPDVEVVGLRRNLGPRPAPSGPAWSTAPTSPSATTTPGGRLAPSDGPSSCSTGIPGWPCSRPGCWSAPAGGSTRCAGRWPPAPCRPPPTCPARRCSGSSPVGRSSAGPPSWRSAGSTPGSGSAARRSCWPSTWPPGAGAWPTWTRWSPTTIPPQPGPGRPPPRPGPQRPVVGLAPPPPRRGRPSHRPPGRPGPAPAGCVVGDAPGHGRPALGPARAPPGPPRPRSRHPPPRLTRCPGGPTGGLTTHLHPVPSHRRAGQGCLPALDPASQSLRRGCGGAGREPSWKARRVRSRCGPGPALHRGAGTFTSRRSSSRPRARLLAGERPW